MPCFHRAFTVGSPSPVSAGRRGPRRAATWYWFGVGLVLVLCTLHVSGLPAFTTAGLEPRRCSFLQPAPPTWAICRPCSCSRPPTVYPRFTHGFHLRFTCGSPALSVPGLYPVYTRFALAGFDNFRQAQGATSAPAWAICARSHRRPPAQLPAPPAGGAVKSHRLAAPGTDQVTDPPAVPLGGVLLAFRWRFTGAPGGLPRAQGRLLSRRRRRFRHSLLPPPAGARGPAESLSKWRGAG